MVEGSSCPGEGSSRPELISEGGNRQLPECVNLQLPHDRSWADTDDNLFRACVLDEAFELRCNYRRVRQLALFGCLVRVTLRSRRRSFLLPSRL